jgi:hypothetical protein
MAQLDFKVEWELPTVKIASPIAGVYGEFYELIR